MPQGSIDRLPSGSLRVRVYAGQDVLTGKPHYVAEVIKPGPHAHELAEQAQHRLVDQVQTARHVKTHASVVQLIEEHLTTAEVEATTKDAYRANLCKHIQPQLPAGPAAAITAHTIEKFKAELRRCRDHCDGRPQVDHRQVGDHACTEQCRQHVCKPLAKATVRKILFLISGAYHAVRPGSARRRPGCSATSPRGWRSCPWGAAHAVLFCVMLCRMARWERVDTPRSFFEMTIATIVVCVGLLVAMVVMTITRPTAAVGVAAVSVFLAGAIRTNRMGVFYGESGVRSRSLLRTRTVPWASIEKFDDRVATSNPWVLGPSDPARAIWIVRWDGEAVQTPLVYSDDHPAMRYRWKWSKEECRVAFKQLNKALARHRV